VSFSPTSRPTFYVGLPVSCAALNLPRTGNMLSIQQCLYCYCRPVFRSFCLCTQNFTRWESSISFSALFSVTLSHIYNLRIRSLNLCRAAGRRLECECPKTCRSRKNPVSAKPSIISLGEPETPCSSRNLGKASMDSL
jgi:hypothetical protein